MQFFYPLLVFLSLLGVSNACLILLGNLSDDRKDFDGTLTDNGKQVCEWKYGRIDKPSNFATCIPGFSAYITNDAKIVGYRNGDKNVAFQTEIIRVLGYIRGKAHWMVSAKHYGC